MSFKGVMEIDDNVSFNIISMDLSFNQSIDATGKPNANPGGGQVRVTVDSTDDNSVLLNWMVSPEITKKVELFFSSYNNGKPRNLTLENAYCVGYHEHFESDGASPMLISLTISSQKFKCGTAELNKSWDSAK